MNDTPSLKDKSTAILNWTSDTDGPPATQPASTACFLINTTAVNSYVTNSGAGTYVNDGFGDPPVPTFQQPICNDVTSTTGAGVRLMRMPGAPSAAINRKLSTIMKSGASAGGYLSFSAGLDTRGAQITSSVGTTYHKGPIYGLPVQDVPAGDGTTAAPDQSNTDIATDFAGYAIGGCYFASYANMFDIVSQDDSGFPLIKGMNLGGVSVVSRTNSPSARRAPRVGN